MAMPIDWQKFSRPVWRAATLVYHFEGGQWIGGAHHNFEKDYARLREQYGEPIKVTQSPLVPEYPFVSNPRSAPRARRWRASGQILDYASGRWKYVTVEVTAANVYDARTKATREIQAMQTWRHPTTGERGQWVSFADHIEEMRS